MQYYILVKSSSLAYSNLEEKCQGCLAECTSIGKVKPKCPINGEERRQGVFETKYCTTFFCSNQSKTTKLFRQKIEALAIVSPEIEKILRITEAEIKQAEQQRMNRLLHNLTSLNAHNIQEVYDLVPQDLLATKYDDQLKTLQKEISNDPKKAALMFLRIAKHNLHMKSEFSIYRKLERADVALDFRKHPIRKVVLNLLHTFFSDFSDIGVKVIVLPFEGKVRIDYESIQVALYHLIENAAKYAMPNSEITIRFEESNLQTLVFFEMMSFSIYEDECDKLFEEGYSGRVAKETKLSGDGVGMLRINQMMNLNNGKFEVKAGKDKLGVNGVDYSNNLFVLVFEQA